MELLILKAKPIEPEFLAPYTENTIYVFNLIRELCPDVPVVNHVLCENQLRLDFEQQLEKIKRIVEINYISISDLVTASGFNTWQDKFVIFHTIFKFQGYHIIDFKGINYVFYKLREHRINLIIDYVNGPANLEKYFNTYVHSLEKDETKIKLKAFKNHFNTVNSYIIRIDKDTYCRECELPFELDVCSVCKLVCNIVKKKEHVIFKSLLSKVKKDYPQVNKYILRSLINRCENLLYNDSAVMYKKAA